MDLNNYKLELDYPCLWTYKIIGSIQEDLRQAVLDVVGELEHTLTFSNNSKTGRYLSLKLELIVKDEKHRLSIYEGLSRHDAIKIVL